MVLLRLFIGNTRVRVVTTADDAAPQESAQQAQVGVKVNYAARNQTGADEVVDRNFGGAAQRMIERLQVLIDAAPEQDEDQRDGGEHRPNRSEIFRAGHAADRPQEQADGK